MRPKFWWRPLTPAAWADFADLFGERGACGGCWCMAWRLPSGEWKRRKGAGNRRAMKKLVDAGREPGILGYLDGRAVAWCSVAPREEFVYLARARTLKPVDSRPVWSVTCFFVRKEYRRRGLSVKMLRAAAGFVLSRGGRLLEGYPVVSRMAKLPDVFAWTGFGSAFARAGFDECPSQSKSRKVVRLALE